ncbi:MAG: histidinol dehydrogenase, partial [Desulfobacterales bacterium]|nr:histidinol dehydrogenase [Desulfobacterales bacterium]
MLIKPFTTKSPEGEKCLQGLLNRFQPAENSCRDLVVDIIEQVKKRGDEAVLEYTRKFDAPDLTIEDLQVSTAELKEAYGLVDDAFLTTLGKAIERIQVFHEREMEDSWMQTRENGTIVGRMVRPVDAAG